METHPDKDAPGLLGALLDRRLDAVVTLAVLRLLYTLALVCVTGANLVLFLIGWSLATGHFWATLGWLILAGTPLLWVAEMVMVRVVIEYLAVQHKISADLTAIRKAVTERTSK
ncbi:MAG: DUF4282 domain-containing protein [Actinoallomurus sp.]